MTLRIYMHPISSYAQKAIIAAYEKQVPFEPVIVNFGDPEFMARFRALWPTAKMPLLHDDETGRVVPESSLVVEYLDGLSEGPVRLLPEDPELLFEVRLWDRIFDNYVNTTIGRIVGDRIRPADADRDPYGVAQLHGQLAEALDIVEARMQGRTWAVGDQFTLADIAAAPALYYADLVQPYAQTRPATTAYLDRLKARPSYARVLEEAAPFMHMFPRGD